MAKVEYVDILPGLEDSYFSVLRSGDRFISSRITNKITLFSRKKKKGLAARSLLPVISALWNAFSSAQKTAWANAGAEMGTFVLTDALVVQSTGHILQENRGKLFIGTGKINYLNGYRLFVQDQTARIVNDLAGVATPSLFHQSWIGNLKISSPATELKIVQLHPRSYWVSKKVAGKKAMYEPVLVTEDLGLPCKISLNYRPVLTSQGGENFAKFYARFWYLYQGQNLYYDLEIPLDYTGVWQHAEATLTSLISSVVRVDLYFHLKGLRGDLYCDNIKLEHSGQNWARDPFCKDILQGFTRAFYQIPMHWAGVILPAGSTYDSVYKDI